MSEQNENQPNENQEGENLNPAEPPKTPLEMVREQQAKQQNRQVQERRPESASEVPGHSVPSDRRRHPQRKMG